MQFNLLVLLQVPLLIAAHSERHKLRNRLHSIRANNTCSILQQKPAGLTVVYTPRYTHALRLKLAKEAENMGNPYLTQVTLPEDDKTDTVVLETEHKTTRLRSRIRHSQQDLLCEPHSFHPGELVVDQELVSCFEICRACHPGSLPICLRRNRRVTKIGLTCLCTYDEENPVTKAVFSIRRGK